MAPSFAKLLSRCVYVYRTSWVYLDAITCNKFTGFYNVIKLYTFISCTMWSALANANGSIITVTLPLSPSSLLFLFTWYPPPIPGPRPTLIYLLDLLLFSCSVAKSCLMLYDPMNCNTTGFPVLHYLLEFAQLMSIESLMPSNHPTSVAPFSSCSQSFPASGSLPLSWLFASGDQSIGASTSASVPPVNIQGWFPLGLTDSISLLSKGLSRAFSSITVWKHQFFDAQLSLWSTLSLVHYYWKKPYLWLLDLC